MLGTYYVYHRDMRRKRRISLGDGSEYHDGTPDRDRKDRLGSKDNFTTQGVSKRAALNRELKEMMAKRDKVIQARKAQSQYVSCAHSLSCNAATVIVWLPVAPWVVGSARRCHAQRVWMECAPES